MCDQGNNRSVHFAYLLKYQGHDVIPVGLSTNSKDTLEMLYTWADKIVLTERIQQDRIPNRYSAKVKLYHVGADHYRRPYNLLLLKRARKLIETDPLDS